MTDAAGGCQFDSAAQTPMRDHVEHFWRLLHEGKVRILVDTECPGFGGIGWYASSSFGDDVAKALAEQRDDYALFGAAMMLGAARFEAWVGRPAKGELCCNGLRYVAELDPAGMPVLDENMRGGLRAALAPTTRPAAKGEG